MKLLNKIVIGIVSKFPESIKNNSDYKEIVKGASTTFVLKLFGFVFSYGFNIFFARMYGAEVMGLFALTITVASIFSLFANMGTQTSLVRFVAQYAGQGNYNAVRKIYAMTLQWVLPLALFLSALFYFLSPFIANRIFHKPILVTPLRITAFVLPFGVLMNVNTASLRGLKKIKDAFIFATVLPPVLNTIGLMGLTYFIIKSYLTPIYANLITSFIGAAYSLYLWKKQSSRLPDTKKENDNIVDTKEIIKVSMPMFMTSAMLLIMGMTDTFMLGMFRSAPEVGVYRIALKLSLIMSYIYISMNSITASKISEVFWSKENNKLEKIIKFTGKISIYLAIPLLIILLIFSRNLMSFFGKEFIIGSLSLSILSIGQFVSAVYGVLGFLLNMSGNEKFLFYAISLAAICNIILNYILINYFGINGAATATSLSIIIMNISVYYFVNKNRLINLKIIYWS